MRPESTPEDLPKMKCDGHLTFCRITRKSFTLDSPNLQRVMATRHPGVAIIVCHTRSKVNVLGIETG